VSAISISELLAQLGAYPVSVQLARIDGKRWAHIAGASTAMAEEITIPHRIQIDEHTGLILRGWDALPSSQWAEIEALVAAVR
jgi:hypothetical protein